MNDISVIARLLLVLVFAVAGIAKLLDLTGARRSLEDFGVPAFLARPLALLLPVVELACAVALIPVSYAWWGASGALTMLLLFCAAITMSLARGRRPDCHCFGQLHSSAVGWTTLLRNAGLAGVAAFVVWQGPGDTGAGMLDRLTSRGRFEAVVLGLAVSGAGVAALALTALFYLLRQNGRLLLRLDAVEAKLGMTSDRPSPPGLPVNSAAPAFTLKDLDGHTVTFDMLRGRATSLLFFFIEPGCSACDEVLPAVAQWQREHADRLLVVPITRGEVRVNRAKSKTHDLRDVLLQEDREVAEAYRVEATPAAVLITAGLIASPLAVGADAIRTLVAHAMLPKPVKKGDLVPALRLPDLSGRFVDLARMRGCRTVLVFWDPFCGFCQAMLGDVKTWERNRPADAPELLVIAAGSSEANRQQGLRSRVLLDPHFTAGQIFGAEGTPSAVVLNSEGRVECDVGVGAAAVLGLAGAVPAGSSLPAG